MLKLTFVVLLHLCLNYVHGQETTYLVMGEIQGTTMTSRNGQNISAYLGIPYAKPPIGPLRFRNPQLIEYELNQLIIADTDGNQCPQLNDDGEVVGDEDCLFLNVYKKPFQLYEQTRLLPVMVFFHGGGWMKGSSSSIEAGPEYLLDRDIILITVNYRLGALGFLSTGDKHAPGNFGLKDQVVALQWVQEHIYYFLGDPSLVTIFGQGAGGCSTSLHVSSPASDGLFHRFISQSGNLGAWWAFHMPSDHTSRVRKLAKYLDCPPDDSKALIDCLRNVDTNSLVKGSVEVIKKNDWWYFDPWSPTTEYKDAPGAFLTFEPAEKLRYDEGSGMKDVPGLLGITADEGLLLTAEFYTNTTAYETIANDTLGFFMYMQSISFDASHPKFSAELVNELYLSNDTSDKSAVIRGLTDYLTDIAFLWPVNNEVTFALRNQPTRQPLYYYLFDYRGEFSKTSLATGNNDNIGVTNGDDLIYIFPPKKLNNGSLEVSKSDGQMIDIMIDMWTNFADTGVPIASSTSDPLIWKPYNLEMKNILKIGSGTEPVLTTEYGYRDVYIAFWDGLPGSQLAYNFIQIIAGPNSVFYR